MISHFLFLKVDFYAYLISLFSRISTNLAFREISISLSKIQKRFQMLIELAYASIKKDAQVTSFGGFDMYLDRSKAFE